uniref:QacE n=1 Tax=Candidatus Methanogaster sp. ANME-2c ERB4 TaxID=2759911 RepID=A0A7G9YAF8_9EURY|nr:hypothetical protein EEEAIAPH_00012 [Methanosarcinales archaeon ANME-2c ERB4]
MTNSRFIVPGQTYTMGGVTSIRAEQYTPSRKWPMIVMGFGGVGLFSIVDEGIGAGSLGPAIIAIAIIAIGAAWWRSKKTIYTVVLSSASGESDAFSSTDEAFIDSIVSALNDAVVSRG